jgi:hypothetical protein
LRILFYDLAQNLLPSRLLSETLQIKARKTINLPLHFMVMKVVFSPLGFSKQGGEDNFLGTPKCHEMKRGWGKLHQKEIYHAHKNYRIYEREIDDEGSSRIKSTNIAP